MSDESQDDLDSTAKFNRDELVRGWHDYQARTPRVVPILKYAAKTDMGQVRENNEDKFEYYEPEQAGILAARGSLFAVADGVGGAAAGQIASEMMLKSLIAGYFDHPAPDVETALRDAIANANDRVYGLAQMIPERNGMGTTLTTAIFIENHVVVAQLGDSRAYLIRDGDIRQVTQDHSWVEEQVRAGLMSRAEAEMSPFRNVITRSIGAGQNVMPDLFVEEARAGDIWVLCSDGLTGHVEDSEILRIALHHAPSETVRQLIELANARGGRDNITAFVIAVRAIVPFSDIEPDASEPVTNGSSASAASPSPSGTQPLERQAVPATTSASAVVTSVSASYDAQRNVWRRLFGR
jgi:PPM family protein phosphatase